MKFSSVNARNDLPKGSYKSAQIVNIYDNENYATAIIGNDFEGDYYETPWFIPPRITPKSSVYRLLLSININPVANEEIDLKTIVGTIVDVEVDTKISKKDGKLYSNIIDIALAKTTCNDNDFPFPETN